MKRLRTVLPGVFAALLAAPVWAAVVAQGFLSQQPLPPGTIVSLSQDQGVVVAANAANQDSLYGVVVAGQTAAFTVDNAAGQLQIASSGVVNAFVSDANGEIKVGDAITVDRLAGVGVKSIQSEQVIGVAQAGFSAKSQGAKSGSYTDASGHQRQVAIGQIPIQIGASYHQVGAGSSWVPQGLQTISNQLAGHNVTASAILVVLLVLIAAFVVAGVMLNSAVRSGITSIGRNPLAKSKLERGLALVVALAFGVIAAGFAVTYLLLRFVPF